MEWRGSSKEAFPLASESFFGDFHPILDKDQTPTGRLQYRAEIDYDWLVNPPKIYEDAWDTWYDYQNKRRHPWVWGSSKTKKATLEALEKGMPSKVIMENYEKAKRDLDPVLLPSAPSMRRRRIFNQDEGEPDIDIALSGSEDFLVRRNRVKTEKRIIHLAWQLVHSSVETEVAMARQTAAAVAVTDHLEKYGYRVKLTGYFGIAAGNLFRRVEGKNLPKDKINNLDEILITVPIKHENMPLDEMRVLTFGLPGVLRFYSFAWITSIMGSDLTALSSGLGETLYDKEFKAAASRHDKVTAVVMSDAPLTMRTIIEEVTDVQIHN